MISEKEKQLLLDNLRQIPLVEVACKKSNISRATFYRWKKEDKEFAKAVEEAMFEGENLITDMSESQLISLIKDRNFQAVQLWLRVHHPKYNPKLEITGNLNIEEEPLTPEQKELVEKSLTLAGIVLNDKKENNENQQNHEARNSELASGDKPGDLEKPS